MSFARRAACVMMLCAGLAAACSRFGAPDDDVADSGVDAASPPSADPCEGFTAPKVLPADQHNVDCPNGPGIDVTKASKDCGSCGRRCEGACASGLCVPVFAGRG